jgi:hypothetical protein
LPNHATGEALEKLRLTMALLRDAGARQELTTPQLDLEWAAWGDDRQQSVVVSVREKYTLRAYRSGADGPQLLYEQPPFDGRIIYRLILSESRWKVERIRPQTSSGP